MFSYGQLSEQVLQPMHVSALMEMIPVSGLRWIAPVGQPIMQTGSTQCMQAWVNISELY
jgi:hypothetical protein